MSARLRAAPAQKPQVSKPQNLAVLDDDSVIVPAPDTSVFLHKPDYSPRRPKIRTAGLSLGARRTLIPILLTGGFILIVLAGLHFLWVADNDPMAGVPLWLVGLMIVLSLVSWLLAAINMQAVKHLLSTDKAVANPPS